MQLRLDELGKKVKKHSHIACPFCTIDYSKEEHLKYLCTYSRGRQRPLLLYVTANILKCPKCGTQFMTPAFFNKKRFRKRRKPF